MIRIVVCNNYDDFAHLVASYFHENLLHYFKDYLMTKMNLMVKKRKKGRVSDI
jgi:hypothetical protein